MERLFYSNPTQVVILGGGYMTFRIKKFGLGYVVQENVPLFWIFPCWVSYKGVFDTVEKAQEAAESIKIRRDLWKDNSVIKEFII